MACGKKTQEPPNVTPAPAQNITGTERFGWAQAAADSHELSTFRYAAYVDGTRVELTGVSCKPPSSPAATDFECSAPLPPMSAGTHALELVVFIVDGGGALRESPRSPPLKVTKAGDEATRGRR